MTNQETHDAYQHGYTEGKIQVIEVLESVIKDMKPDGTNPTAIIFCAIFDELMNKVKAEML